MPRIVPETYTPKDAMGGMKVRMAGKAGRPVSMEDRSSGERVQGVKAMFFGGNQWIAIPDTGVFEQVQEGDWIEADGTLITGRKGVSIGERFELASINGMPVADIEKALTNSKLGLGNGRGRASSSAPAVAPI